MLPVIDAIQVAGTNLNFTATFPPGVAHASLEMRATLQNAWATLSTLTVPTTGGTQTFSEPRPPGDTAFFRLQITLRAASNYSNLPPQYSEALQFVATPSLAEASTNADEAIFHFQGEVDGSDRILIQHTGARWEHVNWRWPEGEVRVNGTAWNPSEINYLTTTGAVPFLPREFDLKSARLEILQARDQVALDCTNSAVIVAMDDTPSGADRYDFKLHFARQTNAPPTPKPGASATLKIKAAIDGSDDLVITAQAAQWIHQHWSQPTVIQLNEVTWDLRVTNILTNSGTNTFLPTGVDFRSVSVTHRTGRDLAAVWGDADKLTIHFADNPNGADEYDVELKFGP